MPINSREKGKSYELKVSKLLSQWCGFELIRTPMSGAWQGTSGDIKPRQDDQHFPFVVECKKQEDWNLEQILTGEGPFTAWVNQAQAEIIKDKEHGRAAKAFLLIFTRNYKPDFIALPFDIYDRYPPSLNVLRIHVGRTPIIVAEYKTFTAAVPYRDLIASL